MYCLTTHVTSLYVLRVIPPAFHYIASICLLIIYLACRKIPLTEHNTEGMEKSILSEGLFHDTNINHVDVWIHTSFCNASVVTSAHDCSSRRTCVEYTCTQRVVPRHHLIPKTCSYFVFQVRGILMLPVFQLDAGIFHATDYYMRGGLWKRNSNKFDCFSSLSPIHSTAIFPLPFIPNMLIPALTIPSPFTEVLFLLLLLFPLRIILPLSSYDYLLIYSYSSYSFFFSFFFLFFLVLFLTHLFGCLMNIQLLSPYHCFFNYILSDFVFSYFHIFIFPFFHFSIFPFFHFLFFLFSIFPFFHFSTFPFFHFSIFPYFHIFIFSYSLFSYFHFFIIFFFRFYPWGCAGKNAPFPRLSRKHRPHAEARRGGAPKV